MVTNTESLPSHSFKDLSIPSSLSTAVPSITCQTEELDNSSLEEQITSDSVSMSEKGNNQSSQSNADPSQMSQSDGHVSLQSDDILQQCSNDAAASHYNMQPQKVLTVTESIASEGQPSEIETDTNPTATDFDVEDKTPPLITPEVPMEKSDGGELEEKIVKEISFSPVVTSAKVIPLPVPDSISTILKSGLAPTTYFDDSWSSNSSTRVSPASNINMISVKQQDILDAAANNNGDTVANNDSIAKDDDAIANAIPCTKSQEVEGVTGRMLNVNLSNDDCSSNAAKMVSNIEIVSGVLTPHNDNIDTDIDMSQSENSEKTLVTDDVGALIDEVHSEQPTDKDGRHDSCQTVRLSGDIDGETLARQITSVHDITIDDEIIGKVDDDGQPAKSYTTVKQLREMFAISDIQPKESWAEKNLFTEPRKILTLSPATSTPLTIFSTKEEEDMETDNLEEDIDPDQQPAADAETNKAARYNCVSANLAVYGAEKTDKDNLLWTHNAAQDIINTAPNLHDTNIPNETINNNNIKHYKDSQINIINVNDVSNGNGDICDNGSPDDSFSMRGKISDNIGGTGSSCSTANNTSFHSLHPNPVSDAIQKCNTDFDGGGSAEYEENSSQPAGCIAQMGKDHDSLNQTAADDQLARYAGTRLHAEVRILQQDCSVHSDGDSQEESMSSGSSEVNEYSDTYRDTFNHGDDTLRDDDISQALENDNDWKPTLATDTQKNANLNTTVSNNNNISSINISQSFSSPSSSLSSSSSSGLYLARLDLDPDHCLQLSSLPEMFVDDDPTG